MLAAWHRPWRLRRRAVAVQRERWVSGKQHGTAQLAQLAHFHEDVGDVVMALAKETRWQHAVELARRQPYWRTYQNAIEACRRGLQWDWCVQLLKEMQIHSYRPGATAYGMVASTLGRSTQWSKALQVIQDMKGGDVPLNLKIFSAVLSGCGQAKEWQVAISVLADAEQHQLQLDTVSCNAAMTACKHSTWEVCQYLLRSMALRQLKPSVVTLAQLVESYGHGMRWAEALETLQGAHRFSLQPDVVLINATAAAVVRGSGWPSALSLFEELPTRSLRADLVTANTLLTTWQVASGWQETLQVLQSFPRWSLRPTTISYNTTMTSALRGQHWPLVLELMAEMRQRKLQFSDSSFNVLASVYEQNSAWEDALQCLAVADQEGLQLSSLTMAVVVSACRKAMQWQQVMALLEDLQDSHLDDVFRAAHMASCVDAGDLPSALAAYRELPLRGARARQEWYVLDLHDLQPEEARLAVRCALLDLVQPKPWPPSGLTFITGRGRHSEGGQSILQPAVLQLLQELQVEAHQNEGRVRIPLRSLMDFVGGIKSVLRDEKLDGFTFHRSNIHERRRLATFARLFPLFCFLGVGDRSGIRVASEVSWWLAPPSALHSLRGCCLPYALLPRSAEAVLNVSLCLGMSYSGLLCLLGIRKVAQELRSEAVEVVQEEGIQHVIVIANYKEVTVDVESDMQEILAHLSNETVLYEEVYKGFRYSVDATLTRALEKMATAYATPTNPQVPGPAVVIRKLFSLLTGASADVKVAFDDTVRQELIRSMPVLNMKYGTLVAMYKQMVTQFPVAWRGSPIAKKLLDVLHSMESIETLDTVELTGIPDLKVLAVSNSTAGAFEFTAKLLKDAGVEGVLLNTTAPVVIPVTLPPELADLAKPNGSS